jgi:hypothetical protein
MSVQRLADILNDRRPAALAQTPQEFRDAVARMAASGDKDAREYMRLVESASSSDARQLLPEFATGESDE